MVSSPDAGRPRPGDDRTMVNGNPQASIGSWRVELQRLIDLGRDRDAAQLAASHLPTTQAEEDPMATPTVAHQSGKIQALLAGTASVWALELGLRLGVIDHLATCRRGATAGDVASVLGLDPQYTHVLLRAMYAAEVVHRDGHRYQLAPHMGMLLLDQDSPTYLGGAVRVLVALRETFLDLRDFARSGTREWWSDFDPEWIEAVAAHCQAYYRRLLDTALPELPDLRAMLDQGVRYLDLACGTCLGPAKLVAAYPKTSVTAVDADPYSLASAQREMTQRGIADRFTFVESFLEDLDCDGGHDVAVINVSLHEARDIAAVVERVHAALEPGGVFLVSEFPFPENEEGCRSVPGQLMCGVQFFEAHIGCQLLPAARFVEHLDAAGFADIGIIDINPLHVVIHGRKAS
jgi:SAM-dependent methyltransferase